MPTPGLERSGTRGAGDTGDSCVQVFSGNPPSTGARAQTRQHASSHKGSGDRVTRESFPERKLFPDLPSRENFHSGASPCVTLSPAQCLSCMASGKYPLLSPRGGLLVDACRGGPAQTYPVQPTHASGIPLARPPYPFGASVRPVSLPSPRPLHPKPREVTRE